LVGAVMTSHIAGLNAWSFAARRQSSFNSRQSL
jgi:hypothetical protein